MFELVCDHHSETATLLKVLLEAKVMPTKANMSLDYNNISFT